MPPLLRDLALLAIGIALLLAGGKLLVSAAVDAARRLDVRPLLVGLTLVAWGTSAPELALNLISAINGRAELALGNVVGANICNLGLVAGICAVIRPLKVQDRIIRVEIMVYAAMALLLAGIGLTGGRYQRWEAGLLLGGFLLYSAETIRSGLTSPSAASDLVPTTVSDGYPTPPMSWWRIALGFVAGLSLLTLGGSFASDAAVGIALALAIPAGIVAVTIVSFGTTLPELVTGVLAVRRGQIDLAVGNAIGSSLFNAGAVFGIVGLIAPPRVPDRAAASLVTMALLAVLLIPISRTFHRHIARIEGVLLLVIYAAFLAVQAMNAVRA